jgi:hypothetical protein
VNPSGLVDWAAIQSSYANFSPSRIDEELERRVTFVLEEFHLEMNELLAIHGHLQVVGYLLSLKGRKPLV